MAKDRDFSKYEDDVVRARALEEALGRLRTSTFIAILGPLAIGVLWLLKFTPAKDSWIVYAILATAPLGALVGIVQYLRVPGCGKSSGRTLSILLSTLVFAAATVALSAYLGLI